MTRIQDNSRTQTSNESPYYLQANQLQSSAVFRSMTSNIKILQEELWIREWESKNVFDSDEQAVSEFLLIK